MLSFMMNQRQFPLLPLFNPEGRLATLPIRVLGIALYISILFVELIFMNLGWCGSGYPLRWTFVVLSALGVIILLEWTEQRYWLEKPAIILAVATIGVRILLTEIAGNYACSGFHTFFYFIPPLLAYLYISDKAALITAGITLLFYIHWLSPAGIFNIAFMDQLAHIEDENVVVEFFIMLVGMVLMLVLGRTLVLEEENRHRAEKLLTELEQSQLQVAELAKVEERNRIAREIHDSVGHHLMAVTVQLEKAKAYRAINPEEADQALDDAKRATQSALADVRESVSTLRTSEGQFELRQALSDLVTQFKGTPVNLTVEGDEAPFAKPVLMALYRAAQEGLTNVEKHANATTVDLGVSLTADHAILTLVDNGSGFSATELKKKMGTSHAHFGLVGLRERVELQGGTLTIGSAKSDGQFESGEQISPGTRLNSGKRLDSGTMLMIRIPVRGLE